MAHLVDPDRVAAVALFGPTLQFLTPPDGDSPCLMRGTIPPGVSIPLHRHADPETFVIDGAVDALAFEGDDFRWIHIGPADVFHVPPNAKHGFRNHGPEPAVMLVVSTSRIGRFFQEVGTPVLPGQPPAAPTAEEIRHFLKTSDKYGYSNATPEENARVGISVPPLS